MQASPQTIAYRDTNNLSLNFSAGRANKSPSRLTIDDLDAVLFGAFPS